MRRETRAGTGRVTKHRSARTGTSGGGGLRSDHRMVDSVFLNCTSINEFYFPVVPNLQENRSAPSPGGGGYGGYGGSGDGHYEGSGGDEGGCRTIDSGIKGWDLNPKTISAYGHEGDGSVPPAGDGSVFICSGFIKLLPFGICMETDYLVKLPLRNYLIMEARDTRMRLDKQQFHIKGYVRVVIRPIRKIVSLSFHAILYGHGIKIPTIEMGLLHVTQVYFRDLFRIAENIFECMLNNCFVANNPVKGFAYKTGGGGKSTIGHVEEGGSSSSVESRRS
ncbi:hypothetical protein R6Q59_012015 [Mikania micrantha]